MKYFFSILFLLLLPFQFLLSLELPADNPVFLSVFGQHTPHGVFEEGLIFAEPAVVRAADTGTVLINLEKQYSVRNFPSTLGNAVIIFHDEGLQTVYANLDEMDSIRVRHHVEMGSLIGKTGNSAWGTAKSLPFQVIDTEKHVYINPLLILPAVDDDIKPKIKTVFIRNEKKNSIELGEKKTVAQGSYDLFAHITDQTHVDSPVINPFRISVLVNGVNIRSIPFEIITIQDRHAYLGNTAFYDKLLYQNNNLMYLGKIMLNRGTSKITITARDITGNQRSKLFLVKVN